MAEGTGQIYEAIENDRAELADTVQALAEKADVKARARTLASEKSQQLQDKVSELTDRMQTVTPDTARAAANSTWSNARRRPTPYLAAAALLMTLVVLSRRHKKHRLGHQW